MKDTQEITANTILYLIGFLEKICLDFLLKLVNVPDRVSVPAGQVVASHAVHPEVALLIELVWDHWNSSKTKI